MPLSTMQKESTVTILDKPVTCVINFSTGCMAILLIHKLYTGTWQ